MLPDLLGEPAAPPAGIAEPSGDDSASGKKRATLSRRDGAADSASASFGFEVSDAGRITDAEQVRRTDLLPFPPDMTYILTSVIPYGRALALQLGRS